MLNLVCLYGLAQIPYMVLKEFLQKKKGQGSERNKDEDIVVGNGFKRIGAFGLCALFNELDLSDNEQGWVGRR